MKNERIITHFQSYTTALGCVKDLTPYFAGKISVITPTAVKNGGEQAPNQDTLTLRTSDVLVDEISDIGGISLGAAAYLIPGLSPVLVGGPLAGMAMGDAISAYVTSQMGPEAATPGTAQTTGTPDTNRSDRYFVIVDVDSEAEANLAAGIIQRHGGQTERPADNPEQEPERPKPKTDFADPCEVERYDRVVDHPNTVETPWDDRQPEGFPPITGDHHNPLVDGYSMEPIRPISPQGWIDANIGYGDLNIVDPSPMTNDDNGELR